MQPKLITFGQAPVFGKCSECGAVVSMVDAQSARGHAPTEYARILQEIFRKHIMGKHRCEDDSQPRRQP
jgi:hypothetical protein